MLRGLYQAGSALQTASLNQELVADNLANATTPGYRGQGLVFEALLGGDFASANPARAARAPAPLPDGIYTSFAAGPMQQTGSPLDVAINGDAFFTLDGPRGPVYTRNGSFQLNGRGELQSASGLRVSGQGGAISIPSDAGEIRIGADGVVYADGREVGRLQLAQFENNQALRRVGTTLFEGPAARQPEPGSVRLEQGYREGSNVQMVQEMISMMIGMRQYEAAERALKSLGDAIGNNTRPQG